MPNARHKPGSRPVRATFSPSPKLSMHADRPIVISGFGSNIRRVSIEEAETLGCHLLRAVAAARGVTVDEVRAGVAAAGVEIGGQDEAA